MNTVKTLIFENQYNSENLHAIKSLVKEVGDKLSAEYKELKALKYHQKAM